MHVQQERLNQQSPLAADSYTVTLRSASDGFLDTTASQLDGDANGTAGGNFNTNFVVAASSAVVVSIPDFARGFGQAVNVPATGTGIPLTLSDGSGVLSVDLDVLFDPSLLTITGASVPAGVAGTVTLNNLTPGVARLSYNTSTALSAGAITFVNLTAQVPDTAPYASKHVLDISDVKINEGRIAAIDDDGVHVAAFVGDTTGNRGYSGLDAALISRVVVSLDSGFSAYQLADPLIIADVTANGSLSGLDASFVSQKVVGLPVAQIPNLPTGITPAPVADGPDPKLSIPQNLSVAAGDTVTVPIVLDVTEPAGISLLSADYGVTFDASRFSVSNVRLGTAITGFSITSNPNNAAGTLAISTFSNGAALELPNGFSGNAILMDFTAKADASSGGSPVDLKQTLNGTATALNEGGLTLIPAPTDSSNDSVDGVVTILDIVPPTVTLAVDNANISEASGVATLTAILSVAFGLPVTIDLDFGGTATNVSDYTRSAAQIVIPTGDTTGTVTLTAVQDALHETNETIVVDITRVTNGTESETQQVIITIMDGNEAPTNILLSASTVAENAAGATIGGVTVTDPDANDTHTFVVNDNRFEIAAGQLKLKAGQSLDFETTPSIIVAVTTTDAGGLDFAKSFTINVTNVNETPTAISLTNATAKENRPGIVIGRLTVTDEDAGDTHTLSVLHDDFELDGDVLRLKAGRSLSYDENNPTIIVPVTAVDSGGLSYTEQIAIIVLAHPLPWQNEANAVDANADGSVSPLDALVIINYLNEHGPGTLITPPPTAIVIFYDTNGDGSVSPVDALIVINLLNAVPLASESVIGEGEFFPSQSLSQPSSVISSLPSSVKPIRPARSSGSTFLDTFNYFKRDELPPDGRLSSANELATNLEQIDLDGLIDELFDLKSLIPSEEV
jgi:hypothetical protein